LVSFRLEMTLSKGCLPTVRGRDPRAGARFPGRIGGADARQVTPARRRNVRRCRGFKPLRRRSLHHGSDPRGSGAPTPVAPTFRGDDHRPV